MSNYYGVSGAITDLSYIPVTTITSNVLYYDTSSDGTIIICAGVFFNLNRSTDSGNTYTQILSSGGYTNSVNISNNGQIILVSDSIRIYVSTNSGVTWSHKFTDANRDWTVCNMSSTGQFLFAGYLNGNYYRSTDFGQNWSITNTALTVVKTNNYYPQVSISNDGTTIFLFITGTRTIYISRDSGITWTTITISGTNLPGFYYSKVSSMSSDGKNIINIYYQGSQWTQSQDYGYSWSVKSPPAVGSLDGGCISGDGRIIVLLSLLTLGKFFISYDFGNTWNTYIDPGGKGFSVLRIKQYNNKTILYMFKDGIYKLLKIDLTPKDIGDRFKPYTSGDKQLLGIYKTPSYNYWSQKTSSGSRQWQAVTTSSDGSKLAACVMNEYIYTSTDSGITWIQRTNAGSQSWKTITSSSNGSILTACVNNGYVWRSTDSGVYWTQQGSIQNWKSITSSSDGNILIGCEFGQYIWRSINSGVTWRAKAALRDWSCVTCSSSAVVAAATIANGYIWISNDTGNTWSENTLSGSRNWSSITSSSNGSLLAACVNGGYIYTSTNSGQTWSEKTSSGSRNWYGISSSSDGLILSACVNNSYIYTSTDAGTTWYKQDLSVSANWNSIASSSLGIKVVACAENDYIYSQIEPMPVDIGNNFNIAKTTNQQLTTSLGIKKNIIPNIDINKGILQEFNQTTTYILNMVSSQDGNVLAACGSQYTYISQDAGKTWKIIAVTTATETFRDVGISGNGKVICAMNSYGSGWLTYDSGNTWKYFYSNNNDSGNISISYDGGIIVRTNKYGTGVSTDRAGSFGTLWNNLPNNSSTRVYNLCMSNDLTVFILSLVDGKVYIAINAVNASPPYAFTLVSFFTNNSNYNISMSSDGKKIGVVNKTSSVYLSTDKGTTWSTITNLPSSTVCNDISISSSGNIVTVCADNYIYRSTNFGTSWSNIYSSYKWKYITTGNDTTIVACDKNGLIYSSLNSGVSSTLQQILVRAFNKFNGGSALSYDGTKMAVIRDNYLYLSTDKGKSWKTITPFNIVNCFDINASYDFSVLIAVPRSGKVLTSTDSGENWRVQTDLSNNWTGSCVSGNGNVLGACTSSGYIWISNDKGVSWNQRAESGSWKFIKSSYDGKILISGRTNSQIWRSTDSGVNWGPIVNSPSITDCWGSLFISSDGSKIIAQKRVDWQVTSSILFFIYKSVDFGVTWNTFTIFNGYYNRQEVTDRSYLAGSTDGQILITGSRSDVIYISNNGGVNWVPYNFTVYSDKWETFSMSGDGNNVIITSNDTTDSNSLTLFISKDSIEVPVNNSVNKDNIIMDIINLYEKQ